jgi:hypothetical protein
MGSMSRRDLLRELVAGAAFTGIATLQPGSARAADGPLVAEDDPAAKAVRYVEDATRAKGAARGSTCANCLQYQGKQGAQSGPCQIFPGKSVVAAGWCASWAPQI